VGLWGNESEYHGGNSGLRGDEVTTLNPQSLYIPMTMNLAIRELTLSAKGHSPTTVIRQAILPIKSEAAPNGNDSGRNFSVKLA